MGDPKRITNKFKKPAHPWNKARIEQEKVLMQKYGLQSKKELWKIVSKLKTYKQNAKRLVALKGAQAEKERMQMFEKLNSYGLAKTNSLDEILGMNPEELLDRRLQTIVVKKSLARSMKQARQMITHKHITINGRKITAPGHLVKLSEEHTIEFYPGSKFFREDHPERPPREHAPGMVHRVPKESAESEKSESKHKKRQSEALPTSEKSEKPSTKKKQEKVEEKEGEKQDE